MPFASTSPGGCGPLPPQQAVPQDAATRQAAAEAVANAAAFEAMDSNHDGVITRAEFSQAVSRGMASAPATAPEHPPAYPAAFDVAAVAGAPPASSSQSPYAPQVDPYDPDTLYI